jgi:hypothetical protein
MLLTGWASLYERIAIAYGSKLKPGLTSSDVAPPFNAVVEGALVRARIDKVEAVLSKGERVLAGAGRSNPCNAAIAFGGPPRR